MRTCALVVAAAAVLASSGCLVVSISPLSTEKDAIVEAAIVGTWVESRSTRYVISRLGERGYKVDVQENNTTTTFVSRLVRLDGVLFLDMAPSTAWAELGVPKEAAGSLDDWFLPLHFFVRIDQVTPSLTVSILDETWLKAYLEKHPAALAHTLRDTDVVLTGSTEDIQKFFRANLKTPDAFETPTVLTRQK